AWTLLRTTATERRRGKRSCWVGCLASSCVVSSLWPALEPGHFVAHLILEALYTIRGNIVDVVQCMIAHTHCRIADHAKETCSILARRIAQDHSAPALGTIGRDSGQLADVCEAGADLAVGELE